MVRTNNNNDNNILFVLYLLNLFLNHTYLGWEVAAYNIENKNI